MNTRGPDGLRSVCSRLGRVGLRSFDLTDRTWTQAPARIDRPPDRRGHGAAGHQGGSIVAFAAPALCNVRHASEDLRRADHLGTRAPRIAIAVGSGSTSLGS
jgi:hypothetical protein